MNNLQKNDRAFHQNSTVKKWCIGASAFFLLMLTACSADSPLKSLTSGTASTQYNKAFWKNEQQRHTALWQQAHVICATQMTPNCGVIASLENEAFSQ